MSVVRLTVIHTYDGGQYFQVEVAIARMKRGAFIGNIPPMPSIVLREFYDSPPGSTNTAMVTMGDQGLNLANIAEYLWLPGRSGGVDRVC